MTRALGAMLVFLAATSATATDLSSWAPLHAGFLPTDFADVAWSPSESRAVAVGSEGGAAWSHDGGASWHFVDLGTAADATGVAWQNELDVWVSATNWSGWNGGGVLLHSSDGGLHWSVVVDDHPTPLTSIAFSDATHGFAGQPADGMLATRDGGVTWDLDEHTDLGLADLHFVSPMVGFAAGTGFDFTLKRTSNGGSEWTQVYDNPDGTITGFSMPDGLHGFLSSPVSVAASNDGGESWATVAAIAETWIVDLLFSDPQTGWIVGSRQAGNDRSGTVLLTSDAGVSWSGSELDEPDRLTSLALTTDGRMVVAGEGGTLLRSDDGGVSWQDLAGSPANHFMALHMDSPSTGWAVGPIGTVHHTNDGGESWSSTGGLGTWTLESVTRAAAGTLYACGSYAFIASDDNGASWEMRYTYLNCHSLWFFNPLEGIAGTQYGVFWTADGGATWDMSEDGGLGLGGVFDFHFFDSSHGFAAAGLGRILETFDGGLSWVTVHDEPPGFNSYLRGIDFATATRGLAVGMDGVILRTVDGGATWTHQSSGVGVHLNGVGMIDLNTALVVGEDGTVLVTENGGATWQAAASNSTADLWDVNLVNPDNPLIAGDWGTVLAPGYPGLVFADGFESGDLTAWSSTAP